MKNIKLPEDNPVIWKDLPLEKGHWSSIKYENKKCFWNVRELIELSSNLEQTKKPVDELYSKIKNGTWFSKHQRPNIHNIYEHMHRAMTANLEFPIILSAESKVMDGAHRILCAKIKGIPELPVVQFLKNPKPFYVKEIGGK